MSRSFGAVSPTAAAIAVLALASSLLVASPVWANSDTGEASSLGALTDRSGRSAALLSSSLSDEVEEPTDSAVELAPVAASEDYLETPEVDEETGTHQRKSLMDDSSPSVETNAGAALIELNSDVAAVGVLWDASPPSRVALRHLTDGYWSEWVDLDLVISEAGSGPNGSGGGTEPAVMVDVEAIEVMVFNQAGGPSNDFSVSIIDPRGEAAVENALDVEQSSEETNSSALEELPQEHIQEGGAEPGGSRFKGNEPEPGVTASPAMAMLFSGAEKERRVTGLSSQAQTGLVFDTGLGFGINTRSAWGADEEWRKGRGAGNWATERWVSPDTTYRGAVVHHTYIPDSNYTQEQVPAIIRSIYRYHTQSVNFGDVGYQLLVDKFGGVWEGRFDSLRRSLVGAQALGANFHTFGISVIGDFTVQPPPQVAQESTAQAIAWMFKKYDIKNPTGTIWIPHQSGRGATVPTILGHYQATATACPGQAFIERLPALRSRVVHYLSATSHKGQLVEPFVDVWSGDPFAREIAWMASSGLSTGTRTEYGPKFKPKEAVTREAVAAFIYRLNDSNYRHSGSSPFADVSPGDRFYHEIVWMERQGLSTGTRQPAGKPLFKSLSNLSREAMAAFLFRASPDSATYRPPAVSPFADVLPSHQFYRQIAWMYESGLSTGTRQQSGKPLYKPADAVSREALAAFLYRSQR